MKRSEWHGPLNGKQRGWPEHGVPFTEWSELGESEGV